MMPPLTSPTVVDANGKAVVRKEEKKEGMKEGMKRPLPSMHT